MEEEGYSFAPEDYQFALEGSEEKKKQEELIASIMDSVQKYAPYFTQRQLCLTIDLLTQYIKRFP